MPSIARGVSSNRSAEAPLSRPVDVARPMAAYRDPVRKQRGSSNVVDGRGPELGEADMWRRWSIVWHVFFFALLAYATAASVVDDAGSVAYAAVRVIAAAALGAWYAYWLIVRAGASRGGLVYLAGAATLWVVLLAAHPAFLLLGFGVFAPLCLHDLRWGLAVVVLAVGGWIWQLLAQGEGISWPTLAGIGVFAAGTLLSVAYVATIVRQSRERQRLIEQLDATRAELAGAERQAGVLEERQRLARDIHDTLIQGFTSIVMLLEAAEASLDADHSSARHVARALRSARENLAESRRLVWALRPGPLNRAGLPEALERLARRLAEETEIKAETVVTGDPRPLAEEQEAGLLRVAQEALTNVRKHARAASATVTISYMRDITVLDVHDDGMGFDPDHAATNRTGDGGMGLVAMSERVHELGGSLEIESSPGGGTTVVAELPARVIGSLSPAAPNERR